MLIILNDDAFYVSWLARHRQGFVVDSKRKPTRNHAILHRATCPIIRPHKRARLTTAPHLKACSVDAAELEAWTQEQTGGGLVACAECQPYHDETAARGDGAKQAPTRLGRDILSYVLDLAVMYLDGEQATYRPSVLDIAGYLGKTPAQIVPAMRRLVVEGHLECEGAEQAGPFPKKAIAYPTQRSLRSIPAFGAVSAQSLDAELARLKNAR